MESLLDTSETDSIQHRKSFRQVLYRGLSLGIVIPVLIYTGVNTWSDTRCLQSVTSETSDGYATQTAHRINVFSERAEHAAVFLATSSIVQSYLSDPESTNIIQMQQLVQTAAAASNIAGFRFGISLHDVNGKTLFSDSHNTDNLNDDTLSDLQRENLFTIWDSSNPSYPDPNGMTLVRKIRLILPNKKHEDIGWVSLTVDGETFRDVLRASGISNADVWLIDKNGNYIAGNAYTAYSDENVYIKEIGGTGWRVVLCWSTNDFTRDFYGILLDQILILGTAILLQILLLFIFSSSLVSSVSRLNRNLQEPSEGNDFSKGIEDDDIRRIARSLNEMRNRIASLTAEQYKAELNQVEREKEIQQIEMKALQAQINPHFLYNTLEVIKYLIAEDKQDSATEMIDYLGAIFRATADQSRILVPLEEELSYADAYLRLQQIRFENRIAWNISAEGSAYECVLPKMTLQPLLENAVLHGLPGQNLLKIQISVTCEDKMLHILVSNDGSPIPPDRLKQLTAMLQDDKPIKSIGLYNVYRRLKLYYGDACQIGIVSDLNGTAIEILLPKDQLDMDS